MPNLLTAIITTVLLTCGSGSTYYNNVFSNNTRESPYILVRVKLKDELRIIVTPNAEFSRILRKQLRLNEQGYVKFMSNAPVKNNTILFDKNLLLIDNSLLVGTCQTQKEGSMDSESELVANYSQKAGKSMAIKLLKNHSESNCVIAKFIQFNYLVTTDDESGTLLIKKLF